MRGKKCPHCGSTTKHNHKYLDKGEIQDCCMCRGKGKKQEDSCSSMPQKLFESLDFMVVRTNLQQTFNEAYLGIGCVFSCTDYGRHKNMTDEELINSVKSNTFNQATKVVDDNDNVMPILIITSDNGYSVKKCKPEIFTAIKKKLKEIETRGI